jgi:2-methylcitrate dehydratase PrpD
MSNAPGMGPITSRHTTTFTALLAERATARIQDCPNPEAQRRAKAALIDTVGVALAAGGDPASIAISDALVELGSAGRGTATVWRTGERTSPMQAALRNGTDAHALDYDDVVMTMVGHPSTVLFPALVAVAEHHNISGSQLLQAYSVGLDTNRAVAAALPVDEHYARGWHATASIGVIGAAVAVAAMRGATIEQLRNCIGIAATTASGLRRNFGTMTKPVHAGLAASNAVLSAHLAVRQVTADADLLDGAGGYLSLFGRPRLDAITDLLRSAPILDPEPTVIKRYPCCYWTHAGIDAALNIRRQLAATAGLVDFSKVVDVTVAVQPHGLDALLSEPPRTGLAAKFNMAYCVMVALRVGEPRLGDFSDDAVAAAVDPDLLSRVTATEITTPSVGPQTYRDGFAVIDVRLDDGRRLQARADLGEPGKADVDAIRTKFLDCAAWGGFVSGVPLFEWLSQIDRVPSVTWPVDLHAEADHAAASDFAASVS